MSNVFDMGLVMRSIDCPKYVHGVFEAFDSADLLLWTMPDPNATETASLVVFSKSSLIPREREGMTAILLHQHWHDRMYDFRTPREQAGKEASPFRAAIRDSYAAYFKLFYRKALAYKGSEGSVEHATAEDENASSEHVAQQSESLASGENITLGDLTSQLIEVVDKHLKRPRQITDSQVELLRKLLRDIGPKSIYIAAVHEDEPVAFAKQLIAEFEAAGWNVTGHDITPKTVDGISMIAHCESCLPPWGEQLWYMLKVELNLPCAGIWSPDLPENRLAIFVSENPLAMIPKPNAGLPVSGSKCVVGSHVDENGILHIKYVGQEEPSHDSENERTTSAADTMP